MFYKDFDDYVNTTLKVKCEDLIKFIDDKMLVISNFQSNDKSHESFIKILELKLVEKEQIVDVYWKDIQQMSQFVQQLDMRDFKDEVKIILGKTESDYLTLSKMVSQCGELIKTKSVSFISALMSDSE